MAKVGPTNSIGDVVGIQVGHATRRGEGWLTGTTVVLPTDAVGATAGVDVRGGGPGTRETDALDPRNAVQRAHAIVLTGGSAFGLGVADGVMKSLLADGRGLRVGASAGEIVPIVPTAVIFDLGRGGRWDAYPDAGVGEEAYAAARDGVVGPQTGVVGAGTGARSGGLKGGIGTASLVLDSGVTVGAIAVVNSVGSSVDPATGELYAARFAREEEYGDLRRPSDDEVRNAAEQGLFSAVSSAGDSMSRSLNTTVGVVATDAVLSKAQCSKMAGIAHDGMARALRPVHTMFDGDTVFGLSTGVGEEVDVRGLQEVVEAVDDCFTRAVGHAILAAETVTIGAGKQLLAYRDAFPSAVARD